MGFNSARHDGTTCTHEGLLKCDDVRLTQRVSIRRARSRALAALPIAALFITACTGTDTPDGGSGSRADATRGPVTASSLAPVAPLPLDEAADRFAQGLSRGDLNDVPLTTDTAGQASKQLAGVLRGMGSMRPEVSVTRADDPGDEIQQATATLHYAWTIHEGQPRWEYDATLPLERSGDGWAVSWTPAAVSPELTATGTRLTAVRVFPKRGRILGAKNQVLVTDRPVRRFGIDRSAIAADKAATSATALAKVVGVDPAAYAKQVTAAGPAAFVEAIVLRESDPQTSARMRRAEAIPGVLTIATTRSLAPTATFAAPLLGGVGEATREIIDGSQGAVRAGDIVGRSGLQLAQDSRLRGSAGYAVQVLGPNVSEKTVYEVAGTPGTDVRTTLDLALQTRAEKALAAVKPAAALVAIRPSTGDLLAAASGPGSKGYSTATLGQYPPGSTFKVVSTLALVRTGTGPDTQVSCPATTTVDGKVFTNASGYPANRLGRVPFRQGFAHSCNTAFVGAAGSVSPQQLAEAAAALGLAGDPRLGVPAYLGQVPTDADGAEHAAAMIGQGKVVASPLGMAVTAASVGAGRQVTPRFLLDPAPSSDESATVPAAPVAPLTDAETTTLRALMRAVVTEGTGRALAGVRGAPVLAKTGTAEYGTGTPPPTHAWMVAVHGDLAVAVLIEGGASGASTAGPVLRTFLDSATTP